MLCVCVCVCGARLGDTGRQAKVAPPSEGQTECPPRDDKLNVFAASQGEWAGPLLGRPLKELGSLRGAAR